MDEQQAQSPVGVADHMLPFTITHLILIALFAIAVIIAIWWGVRMRRKNNEALHELEEEQRLERADADAPVQEKAPPPPPIKTAPPPVAPPPPPIADSETVAKAPAPATPPAPAPQPSAPAKPQAATSSGGDDLLMLKGVGPKLATKLNELGIIRFEQIATLTPDQAAALDGQLGNFKGRMARDRWQEQAEFLAKGDREGFEAKFGKLG
ncbi:hypothetical protein GCM10023219_09040 [Stakelama sediminis]|uniref:Putative flap endonuclease-1-like 5' DNA nuclease n=1 Tax=Stakelama sediminis TaxID=463200 RepID=A0A840YVN9_9SPHN|nr:hypothetical protein [Stakelama sediminis]MBB5717626.1 putative flap endonuclease-1-like 5' DNA nuclease [Stakelama sediminis]